MRTGEFYTLKAPDEHYYGYEVGVKYECVDGENAVLRSPSANRGWDNPLYGEGSFFYVASEKFIETQSIVIGGE